jgi:signal transduction histidine kinase/ActR/RegA family two-component response regulator
MMFQRRIRFHVCLGAALGVLILLLAVVLAGTLGEAAKREVAGLAAANLDSMSQQMARELSTGLEHFAQDVQAQASREIYRNPASTPAEIRAALDQFVASHPEYATLGLADARSGAVLAANGGMFEDRILDRLPLENGSKGLFIGEVHDEARLAELLPRSPLGAPARFLDIAAPVRNERGQASRVLAAHLNWQWADSVRNSVLGPVRERRGIELLVVDSNNRVVLAPSSVAPGSTLDQLVRKMPGASTKPIAWTDGTDYLTVITPIVPRAQVQGKVQGWKVVARLPAKLAFAPVAAIQRGFFAGALLLGLAGAGIAWFVTRRLLDPAHQLDALALEQGPGSGQASGVLAYRRSRSGDAGAVADVLHRLAGDSRSLARDALARESEFITLAETLPHIVWQSDDQGLIDYVNGQWKATFGPAAISRIDQLASLAHQADLLGFMDAWSASRIGGADLDRVLRLRSERDNDFLWYRLQGRALRPDGQHTTRWVGTITNVHDAVLQAERTEQALEKERRARTEAERVAVMADEFLATLSHELRTPLNAIAGWAELLARRAGGDDTVVRAAEVINRNVQLQAGLINDLLDTSAIIAGKVALEAKPFDAAALLADVALSQKPAAERKGVRFDCNAVGPMPIAGDERRLNQAVTNLVSNAIKFTDAGGQVTLDARQEGESLLISVSDTGCGIAPQVLPHAFERFRQKDAALAGQRGGLGLGLAIAASLVRLHGGAIEAHSAGLGQGSRFIIRLPALAGASDSVVSAVSAGTEALLQQFPMTPLAGVRILVTDDEEDARLATQSLLGSFGATVTVSASGSETLRLLDRQSFDLLLCDIGMPGMDGHELIRAIRKRARDKGAMTPAIALTAFAMTRDERASSLAGFDAHVAKPLSAQTLIETICSVCEVGNTH